MKLGLVAVVLALASCASRSVRTQTIPLARDSAEEVERVLQQHYGPFSWGCGMGTSEEPPAVRVEGSRASEIRIVSRDIDERDFERAVAIARAVDEMELPAGAEAITLRYADANEVVSTLNDLIERAFWKARRGVCVLPLPESRLLTLSVPPLESPSTLLSRGFRPFTAAETRRSRIDTQAWVVRTRLESGAQHSVRDFLRPPPHEFEVWDECALVVFEAHRDERYFENVRALVARLDVDTRDR